MSDLFGNHIVGFPTRRLIRGCSYDYDGLNMSHHVRKLVFWVSEQVPHNLIKINSGFKIKHDQDKTDLSQKRDRSLKFWTTIHGAKTKACISCAILLHRRSVFLFSHMQKASFLMAKLM